MSEEFRFDYEGSKVFKYEDRSLIIGYSAKITKMICTTRQGIFHTGIFGHDNKSELKWRISADLPNHLLRIEPVDETINKRFKYILSIDVNTKEFYSPRVYDGSAFQCKMPANSEIGTMKIKIVYPYEAITFCSCALVKSKEAIVQQQSVELVTTLPKMITKAASRNEYTDVKFSFEDKLVVAHKHILADRSEVFRRMFSWNADDPNANEPIQIIDTSYAAFELFMDVIYFGTVPSNSEMFLEMIVLADKYDIADIKAAIEASAIPLMNSDNVINMLITSELHNAHRMKNVALEFCAKNPMTEISNVQNLAKYPDLMVQVLTYNQKHFKKA